MLFEQAATPTPVTLPAHASLMTGLLPNRHGVRDNGLHRLPQGIPTLAGILADEGYETAAVVDRGDRVSARRLLSRALAGPLPPALAADARALLQRLAS